MDMSQYLDMFLDESNEHLQALNEQILSLEQHPEDEQAIHEIFRVAHTLKGMAGTMGFKKMQNLTHTMENVFSNIREGNQKVSSDLVDALFNGLDILENMLQEISDSGKDEQPEYESTLKLFEGFLQKGGEGGKGGQEEAHEKKDEIRCKAGEITWEEDILTQIENEKKDGHAVYGLTVFLSARCVLKGARAFLVYKAANKIGKVLGSNPTMEQIENEEFELDFTWLFSTDQEKAEVKATLEKVLEVEQVVIEPFEVKKKEEPKPAAPAPTQTEKANPSPGKETKNLTRSIRVDIEKLDGLMNQVSELIIAKNSMTNLIQQVDNPKDPKQIMIRETVEYMDRITTGLHESVMGVRMVPIDQVFQRFPRMIRDLSKSLNKKIQLVMEGGDTELDRTVIDELNDPLMHLLRNSCDHGIEGAEDRVNKNKPEEGTILLNASQQGDNVVIQVSDDGKGLDVEKIAKKSIEKNLATEEQLKSLSDDEIVEFIFAPGFSTADKISEVSGRGVGLDVVKTKIESLGGSISATTQKDHGSTFTIQLPLTLAIIQTLMISLGEEKYAVSLNSIDIIEEIHTKDVKRLGQRKVIYLRDQVVPIVDLREIMGYEPVDRDVNLAVILHKGDRQRALIVDNLEGQLDAVIKPLDSRLLNTKLFSGATILGDGNVALILDINALF